jgi:hypothetical protein
MSRVWLRLTVAILFVIVWSAPFYIDAATINNTTGPDVGGLAPAAFLVVWVGVTLLTGFVVRWPALVLPVLIYLALLPLGANPEDSDGWSYAALFLFPAGFFSFFALGAGWLGRIGFDRWLTRRVSRPRETDRTQRATGKWLLIPLGLLCVAGLLLLVLVRTSTSTDMKSPRLSIYEGRSHPPQPGDTVLPLAVGDVDTCGSGDDRVIDPQVNETGSEVVVRASLEIHHTFPCDTGTAEDTVTVNLQHPLGNRMVIDDSRGLGTVIWPKPAGFVGLP